MNRIIKLYTILVFVFCCSSSVICQTGTTELTLVQIKDSLINGSIDQQVNLISLLDQYTNICKDLRSVNCHQDSINRMKFALYYRISRSKLNSDLDTTRKYIRLAKQISLKLPNTIGYYNCLFTEAEINFKNGTYNSALVFLDSCSSILKIKSDPRKLIDLDYMKSSVYRRMGKQDSAIAIVHRAIRLLGKYPKDETLANCFQVIGLTYTDLRQYDDAKKYLDLSKDLHVKLQNEEGHAALLTSIGNVVYATGDTLGCIPYYRLSGDVNGNVGNEEGVYVNYFNTSNAYFQIGQYDSSLVYLNKAKSFKGKLGARKIYMIDYLGGALNVKTSKESEGIAMLTKAYNVARKRSAYIDSRDISSYLAEGYNSIGEFDKAYQYQVIHAQLKDSVVTVESAKAINELKTKYETEKKTLLIENLELANSKQRQRLVGGSIALILFSFLTFFLFRLYRKLKLQKAVIAKALTEKDLLLREIHHRVKNNLQLVSSLLTLQSHSIDDETALQAINEGKSRVRSMALIHQDLYNKENLTGINVKEYIEKLSKELFYTYTIDSERISLSTDIQQMELDVDTLVPLGLIINELITNSLKYAFPNDRSGTIEVRLFEMNNKLHLIITDNGVGFNLSEIRENSFGATLVSALTEQLEGEIEIDSSNGTKTTVVLSGYDKL